jgi:KDO2-lipid IV(A) lauroyltransferase
MTPAANLPFHVRLRGIVRRAAKLLFHYVLTPLIPRLPLALTYACAGLLGRINYRLSHDNRALIRRNLKVAFREKSEAEIEHIVRGVFDNHAKLTLEILLLPAIDERLVRERCDFEGFEHIEEALRRGKGVVFTLGHMGIYYVAGVITDRMGVVMNDITQDLSKLDVSDLDRKILTTRLEQYQRMIRGKMVSKGMFLREIVRSLKRNEGLSLFVDAKASVKEVPLDFLGVRTNLQPGAISLALRTGCTVLPAVTLRTPDNRWRIIVAPPLEIERTGNEDRDVEVNLAKCARHLEGWIRRHPEQWHLWRELHLRWVEAPREAAERAVS